jgi:alpha,alpha-trehalase
VINFFILIFLASTQLEANELKRLYKTFDKDQDKKITIEDNISKSAVFHLKDHFPVQGTYYISNLAQELKLAEMSGHKIQKKYVFENPVDRISRSIKERFWDSLTRRIDLTTLETVIADTKIKSDKYYLYVPHDDHEAFAYYNGKAIKNVEVRKLPKTILPGFITSLGNKHGLLSLALKDKLGVPYVVPGGRFNEMYGWDSYFHVLGTLADGRLDLAKGMVDNFVYQINYYGKILNANRTYYLSRSHPPFFTSMLREVYAHMPKNNESKKWLTEGVRAAIKEYQNVWMGADRLTPMGLSRYAGFDAGIPPEVEEGHFDNVLSPFAKKHKLSIPNLISQFNSGKVKDPKLLDFFHQDRAVRESGHDTTYRWRVGSEDRASDFVTVDLNSLLFKYERDLFELISENYKGNFEGTKAQVFLEAANKRKKLMRKYLWDSKKGLFFDYNWKSKTPSSYISATTLYPLWAGDILSDKEATTLSVKALEKLEYPGGIVASAEESLKSIGPISEDRQWDYPNGWAPHQILAWQGLKNYKQQRLAQRLVYRWLYMITKMAMDYNGTIPEKYNVVSRSHKVFTEYGNVGTKFSYITMEGFGWMNASYQLGLNYLSPLQLKELRMLTPPEKLFPKATRNKL